MKRQINQNGTYYNMEAEWAQALKGNGSVKNVEWNITYGTDKRPVRIDVIADVNDNTEIYTHIN